MTLAILRNFRKYLFPYAVCGYIDEGHLLQFGKAWLQFADETAITVMTDDVILTGIPAEAIQ